MQLQHSVNLCTHMHSTYARLLIDVFNCNSFKEVSVISGFKCQLLAPMYTLCARKQHIKEFEVHLAFLKFDGSMMSV